LEACEFIVVIVVVVVIVGGCFACFAEVEVAVGLFDKSVYFFDVPL